MRLNFRKCSLNYSVWFELTILWNTIIYINYWFNDCLWGIFFLHKLNISLGSFLLKILKLSSIQEGTALRVYKWVIHHFIGLKQWLWFLGNRQDDEQMKEETAWYLFTSDRWTFFREEDILLLLHGLNKYISENSINCFESFP